MRYSHSIADDIEREDGTERGVENITTRKIKILLISYAPDDVCDA